MIDSGLIQSSKECPLVTLGNVPYEFIPNESRTETGRTDYRVVHLGKFFHPAHGGIERTVRALAHAQTKLGCTVRVICLDHERGRPTQVLMDGPVEVVRLRRATSFGKLDYCPDLPRFIRDSEADLIHLHAPNPTMILGLILSGDRRPLVISHHSDVIKQRIRRMLFSPMERACYSRAQMILAMSPPYINGSSLLRRYRDRVVVLPIGLDLAPFLNPSPGVMARSEVLKRTYPGPIWFSCGRLVYYKGIDTALRAMKSLPGTLLIAGDGPARLQFEKEAELLKVSDRVRFLGKIPSDDELNAHYLAAQAFLFPSNARSEAYGLVQVEAMASGCPVINASIPHSGVSWVSRHDETGLTVPVDDPDALVISARRLFEDPILHNRLSAGARARAVAEFQFELMGKRSLAIYNATLLRV